MLIIASLLVTFALLVVAGVLWSVPRSLEDSADQLANRTRAALLDAVAAIAEQLGNAGGGGGDLELEVNRLRALIADIDERVERRYRRALARERREVPDVVEVESEEGGADLSQLPIFPGFPPPPPPNGHAPEGRMVRASALKTWR
jgi:hypothetical protein